MTDKEPKVTKSPSAKPAKVAPQEYTETRAEDPVEETAKVADTKKSDGWELGKPAPTDLYKDLTTGELTESQPHRGQFLIRKGQPVSLVVARAKEAAK